MRYYVNRVGQAVVTVTAVITISFFMIRLMPGNLIDVLRAKYSSQGMAPELVETKIRLYTNVHPDAPLHVQYINYVQDTLTGDLGQSLVYARPVTDILAEAVPWTVFVMGTSLLIMYAIGIIFGGLMAYWEGSRVDNIASFIMTIFYSIPFYIIGLLLIAFIGFQTELFPSGGLYSTEVTPGLNIDFLLDVLRHATLPILAMVLTRFGGPALAMRGNSISEIGKNYVRVAQLRGLSTRLISINYIAKNAVLPLYTGFIVNFATMFGASIILEEIFTYSGIGYYMFQAIRARDYPLMMGAFLVISITVVIGLFIADLTYSWIDPRIQSPSERNSTSNSFRSQLFAFLAFVRRKAHRNDSTATTMSSASDRTNNSSLFTATSEVQIDSRKRVSKWYREHVYAPAMILWSDTRARIGILIIAIYLFIGTIGVMIVSSPETNEHESLLSPFQSLAYPLGTNHLGQSLFELMVHATPTMLKMIIAGALFAVSVATIVGCVAGYLGGFVDQVLMTISDIMMAIPGLVLIIVIATIFQPENPYLVGILITIHMWAGLARSIRSQILSLRQESYVEASRVMGQSTPYIIFNRLIPNIASYISVNFMKNARNVIFGSVALYFLGILPRSSLNWGVMLNQAYINGAMNSLALIYWLLVPMITISTLTIGLIFVSQGMDQLFNPRIRARHESKKEQKSVTGQQEPTPSTVSEI